MLTAVPMHLLYSNFVCGNTRNAHGKLLGENNFEHGMGRGGGGGGRLCTVFKIEEIVVRREIQKHTEMSQQFCPGSHHTL